jgi:hypothetical protein
MVPPWIGMAGAFDIHLVPQAKKLEHISLHINTVGAKIYVFRKTR